MAKIYLCGPINGRSDEDCKDWRAQAKQLWEARAEGNEVFDPMVRDYRGREHEPDVHKEIVEQDVEDIVHSNGLLVWFDKPSVGTSMEIFFASNNIGLPVVVVNKSGKPVSPWMRYFATSIVEDMESALDELSKSIEPNTELNRIFDA